MAVGRQGATPKLTATTHIEAPTNRQPSVWHSALRYLRLPTGKKNHLSVLSLKQDRPRVGALEDL
jgi:hypothetical protein